MRSNDEIADLLERVADLLEAQHADAYRVRAWRLGAQACRTLDRPLSELFAEGGVKTLLQIPHIGESLAAAIEEVLLTGRLRRLERLEGEVGPEELFTTLPGVGDELAHRIREALGIDTLEELEAAAHDGRLDRVPGFGPRRVRAVRDQLALQLGRASRRRVRREPRTPPPSVAALLDVDREYRERAAAGRLHRIAPRRFNPDGEAWLPILHTAREGWYLTALYSNSARAHRLGTTRDWVVILFERDGEEGRCTVVTEHAGPLRGERVVRGREPECAALLRKDARAS